MRKTLSEKILARAARKQSVSAGDIVWVDVDKAMMDDILGPRVEIAEKMQELGVSIQDPGRVVVISDHYTPPANARQADIVKFTREWSEQHGIENYYEFAGPCHQVMAESGHVLPGTLVLGTDSHTCMGGALGAFASGVGSTEMLGILATGQTWLRVPETIRVRWEGILSPGVMAKDVSLKTIGTIGHAGATYKTVEYQGGLIKDLSMDERFCLSNMAVEMGAKTGLIPPDEKVERFLSERGISCDTAGLFSDEDADFCKTYRFEGQSLSPQVSCPHEVDNVRSITELDAPVPIHQAYLGSCTGGRYNDLVEAAKIMKGKKVAKGVRMLVSPASQSIWKKAYDTGILGILQDAGCVVLAPTCGVCVGLHSGILGKGEVCLSSSNRNFLGRMGSRDSYVYLGSPVSVAAAAVVGRIVDPRNYI